MRTSFLFRFCTYITSFLSAVSAFSVTFGPGTPTQCDAFTISWTGGQAPFEILLTPKFHPLVNISVPSSAFSNGKGSYSISQLPLPKDMQFLLTMSDGTGFGTGGTTTLLTVGAPIANNNCDTKGSQDFYFQLPSALKQCGQYNFTGYDLAIQPVTITGLVPGGESVVLQPPNGANYSWIADVQEGTSLIFFMTDSQGRQGGASDLETVAASTDGSCLVAGSISSTVSAPSQPTSNQITSSGNKAHNAGIIAGATVGGVAFLGLLIILGICCKRRASRSLGIMSSHKRQSSQLQRKDDDHEAKQDGLVQQNYPSQYHVDRVSHLLPTVQPGNQSHLINMSTNDSHMRQISYTDSFAGNSSISSAVGGQTALPNPYPYQTLPVGLAPPVHPGAHSHLPNTSAGNFTINDPHASFMQIQPPRLSSNIDAFTRYGDAGSSSVSSASRPMPVMPGQTASQYHPSLYQTNHIGQPAPPIQPESIAHLDMSAGSTVSDPPSPSATESRLHSIIERFTSPADAGSSSFGGKTATATSQTAPTQVLVHTDIEDVSSAADSHTMVELPPQYADRQLHVSQPALASKQKSSQF